MSIIRVETSKITDLYPVFTLPLFTFPPYCNHEFIFQRNTNVFRQQVSNLKDYIWIKVNERWYFSQNGVTQPTGSYLVISPQFIGIYFLNLNTGI